MHSPMPSVLIVDDEPHLCAVMALTLEAEGFQVTTAADGNEALEALAVSTPDAVVLDIMMPGVDGFAVLSTMRERGLGQGSRVVVMTCRNSGWDHLRAWELGADDYLTKPFDPAVLAERLRQLLVATPEALESRRLVELEQAALLDRLELAGQGGSGYRRARRSRRLAPVAV